MTDRSASSLRPRRRSWFAGRFLQPVAAVGLLLFGFAVAQVLVFTRPEPERRQREAPPRLVRVFEASRGSHRCSATAFGTSRASRQWGAIAETSGEALEVHPRFEPGEVLPAGTLLVQIDKTEYELARRRYASEAQARLQQLEELSQSEANLEKIRAWQREQATLAARDVERIREIRARNPGAITEAELDAAQATQIARALSLQETENSLALIPLLRARAEAERDVAEIHVEQAQREIDKCSIRLPFRARCVARSVDENQYIHAGQQLGSFIGLDTAEVVAMVEARKGASLFPRGIPHFDAFDLRHVVDDEGVFREVLDLLDAVIHWGTPPRRGKVTRIGSSLDPDTRTFPVVVEVADPYAGITPGVRPPLVPDVFCEVTLYGATIEEIVVIPRDCLHEIPRAGAKNEFVPVVYLLAGGTRGESGDPIYIDGGYLKIQEIEILAMENDLVLVASGIEEGDLVIISDLYVAREHWGTTAFGPASEAMPLRGVLETLPTLHQMGPSAEMPVPIEKAEVEVAR